MSYDTKIKSKYYENILHKLTISGAHSSMDGTSSHYVGESVTVSVGTNTGYIFKQFNAGGTPVTNTSNVNGKFTFIMPDGDVTLTAVWEKGYNVSFSNPLASTTGAGTYAAGSTVSINTGTNPDPTQAFFQWTFTPSNPQWTKFNGHYQSNSEFIMPENDLIGTLSWYTKEPTYVSITGPANASVNSTVNIIAVYGPENTVARNEHIVWKAIKLNDSFGGWDITNNNNGTFKFASTGEYEISVSYVDGNYREQFKSNVITVTVS